MIVNLHSSHHLESHPEPPGNSPERFHSNQRDASRVDGPVGMTVLNQAGPAGQAALPVIPKFFHYIGSISSFIGSAGRQSL
jgi:hypothetical protein